MSEKNSFVRRGLTWLRDGGIYEVLFGASLIGGGVACFKVLTQAFAAVPGWTMGFAGCAVLSILSHRWANAARARIAERRAQRTAGEDLLRRMRELRETAEYLIGRAPDAATDNDRLYINWDSNATHVTNGASDLADPRGGLPVHIAARIHTPTAQVHEGDLPKVPRFPYAETMRKKLLELAHVRNGLSEAIDLLSTSTGA